MSEIGDLRGDLADFRADVCGRIGKLEQAVHGLRKDTDRWRNETRETHTRLWTESSRHATAITRMESGAALLRWLLGTATAMAAVAVGYVVWLRGS